MGLLDIFLKKKNAQSKDDQEQNQYSILLHKNLKDINFTDSEIKEVTDIISSTEEKIEALKQDLTKIFKNDPDFKEKMEITLHQIRLLQEKMSIEIKDKVIEIKKKKGI